MKPAEFWTSLEDKIKSWSSYQICNFCYSTLKLKFDTAKCHKDDGDVIIEFKCPCGHLSKIRSHKENCREAGEWISINKGIENLETINIKNPNNGPYR